VGSGDGGTRTDAPGGGTDGHTGGGEAGGGVDAGAGGEAGGGHDGGGGQDGGGGGQDGGGGGQDSGGGTCQLTTSGPVSASSDGQVIENLRIEVSQGPAIEVDGRSNVTIRNCEIRHGSGPGISFNGASNLRIENVSVLHTGAPASGQNPDEDRVNIVGYGTTGLVIDHARLEKGSSGVYLIECPGAQVRFVEGHDFRGPFPRGQVVQFDKCDDSLLEDFSCENSDTSWPEDIVSVYQSSNVTVRRGLVDGNNSVSGVGVMFEQSGSGHSGGLAEDVDAVHQGNGCFSGYPGYNVTFRRTRSRDNFCTDQGRGEPSSGGLAWAGSPESSGLRIEDSRYHNLCQGLVWDESVFTAQELTDEDFTPRAPLRLTFCWQ